MDSQIDCLNCKARLKIPVNLGGKKARCPKCKNYVVVENTASSPDGTYSYQNSSESTENVPQGEVVSIGKAGDVDNLTLAVGIGFSLLVLVTFVQFNLFFALGSIGFIWINVFGPLFTIQKLNREFLLKTYLKQEGPIYEFLKNRMLLTVGIPLFSSLTTSFLAYVDLLCMSLMDMIIVSISYYIGRWFVITASKPIKANLNNNLVELVSLRITLLVSVILMVACIAGLALIHGIQKDYSELTADEMATQIIAEHKHPVKLIRDITRTIKYSELQLLRIRDSIGGKYGWAIYLLFLIPHALPAVGFACFFLNLEIFFNDNERKSS